MPFQSWHEVPFLRLFLPFAVGSLVAINAAFFPNWLLYVLLGLLLLTAFFMLQKANGIYYSRFFFGVFASLSLAVFGMIWVGFKTEILRPAHFGHSLENATTVTVQLTDKPVEKKNSFRLAVKVLSTGNDSLQTGCEGKAYI